MVRKSLRTRHRSMVHKPLKIPDQVPEEPESKSAPLVRSCPAEFVLDVSAPASPNPRMEQPARPANQDTDTETEVDDMATDDAEKDARKCGQPSPCLTDFSNYLGVSIVDDDDDEDEENFDDEVSVTVVDSEAFSRMQSVEDLYGWEAALSRKPGCGISDHGVCDGCDQFQYRRAGGSKRSLLHRVFSSTTRKS